jgi:hypothetical protein
VPFDVGIRSGTAPKKRRSTGVARVVAGAARGTTTGARRVTRRVAPRQAVRQRPSRQYRRHRPSPRTRNAQTIVRVGRAAKATHKQKLSALATALVESNLRNVRYGDRDSLGLFQQRPSQGWGAPKYLLNPSYAAWRYYDEAKRLDRRGLRPGDLAQVVQKSAYPERYGQRLSEAKRLLRRLEKRA